MSSDSLYKELVETTAAYLGPAADRFVSRQVVGHLDKSPEKLNKNDLSELIKWIKPTMAILMDDSQMVDKYIDKLNHLIDATRRTT